METIVSGMLMIYLQGNYPGGNEAFKKDGGMICLLPDLALVYIPKEVPFLKEKLSAVCTPLGVTLEFPTELNYTGMEPEDVEASLVEAGQQILSLVSHLKFAVAATPMSLVITIIGSAKPDELRKLEDVLKGLPGVRRFHLIQDKKVVVAYDSSVEASFQKAILEQEKRTSPIDAIDIAIVTKAIDQCNSVEDFLKNF